MPWPPQRPLHFCKRALFFVPVRSPALEQAGMQCLVYQMASPHKTYRITLPSIPPIGAQILLPDRDETLKVERILLAEYAEPILLCAEHQPDTAEFIDRIRNLPEHDQ